MEKANEMKMKWKLELKTGNGNWKGKWEQITHESPDLCLDPLTLEIATFLAT